MDTISAATRLFQSAVTANHIKPETHYLLSPFRPSTGQTGPSFPGRQPSESRTNPTGCPVSVPPPLSQQDAAQALLHGGERRRSANSLLLRRLSQTRVRFSRGGRKPTSQITAASWAGWFANLPTSLVPFPLLPDQLDESPLMLKSSPKPKSVFLCSANVRQFTVAHFQYVPRGGGVSQ